MSNPKKKVSGDFNNSAGKKIMKGAAIGAGIAAGVAVLPVIPFSAPVIAVGAAIGGVVAWRKGRQGPK